MSLIAVATLAAVAAAASYLIARRRRSHSENTAEPTMDRFAGLPLALGDVVSVEGAERWLAGAALGVDRDAIVGVLFFAPEGAVEKPVMVLPLPDREIFWLDGAFAIDVTAEPPTTLELDRSTLVRRRRIPVRLERLGHGVPQFDETALFATYEGNGRDVAVVVTSASKAFAWRGTRYLEGEYERLGRVES
jgi:hypothetical protein